MKTWRDSMSIIHTRCPLASNNCWQGLYIIYLKYSDITFSGESPQCTHLLTSDFQCCHTFSSSRPPSRPVHTTWLTSLSSLLVASRYSKHESWRNSDKEHLSGRRQSFKVSEEKHVLRLFHQQWRVPCLYRHRARAERWLWRNASVFQSKLKHTIKAM